MPKKRFSAEQIVTLLRQIEVPMGQGNSAQIACREAGTYRLSERHACRLVGKPRGTQRYTVIVRADEDALTRAIIGLASEYGRYGYRRITKLLNDTGLDLAPTGCNGSGAVRGSKYPRNKGHAEDGGNSLKCSTPTHVRFEWRIHPKILALEAVPGRFNLYSTSGVSPLTTLS